MQIKASTAIVTGGASGLGEATARMLVAEGANVAILDFNEERGNLIAFEFEGRVIFCKTNVTDEESVQKAIRSTMGKFGSLHFLLNCAGIGKSCKVIGKSGLMDMAGFRSTIEVNLMGTVNVIRLAAEAMIQNRPNEDGERGVIVNTASIAAFEGQIGQAAYSASKAGIVGITLPIAREFASYGIRVATIAPGLFETPMLAGIPEKARAALIESIPFPRRLGKPSEYALLAKQIIENPAINGETIRLDCAIRMAPR